MNSLRIFVILLMFCGVTFTAASAERVGNALVFRVPTLPQAVRHLNLLESPAILALVLENNGFNPSLSSRLVIKDRSEFSIGGASVRFTGRKGSNFLYEGSLKVPLSSSTSALRVSAEVDTSAIASGTVVIRVYSPLSGLLPTDILDRIEFKLRILANEAAQRQVVGYLDEIAARQQSGTGKMSMFESILIEAFNREVPTVSGGREVGDAEPLSEQYALIATLAIWLILVPTVVLGRIWWRVRRRKRNTAA